VILFFCNAGPDIGFGHLMRCRALAQALRDRGETCIMTGPSQDFSFVGDSEIFCEWVELSEWRSSSDAASELLTLANKMGAGVAVLDDYRVDEGYQLILREQGLRWLQFDGTAGKPLWADWILNSSPTASPEDYQQVRRKPEAKILLGPRYALLRTGFSEITTRPCNRELCRVLVTFGGGDDRGAIELVLSSLVEHAGPEVKFLVVSGKNNPRNPKLNEWIQSYGMGRVEIEIDPPDVPRAFASCDLAIMAGGGSTYEAACCRVPMMLMSIADNQAKHGAAWEKTGAAIYLGDLANTSKAQLQDSFNQLRGSSQKRAGLCTTAHSICDGLGALRVANVILD
jgi:UDP-2,4-diacetamido-2,4,6-trideoxy-beta-L-altropyranose hydrolase